MRHFVITEDVYDSLKPGLKDRKHMLANTFSSFPRMPWSSHSCNDRRH